MAGTRISHKALFQKMRDDTAIAKATQYAHWTLPQLMADFNTVRGNGSVIVERDYQEMGALLVNNLATKLAAILFPTSHSFFRVDASQSILDSARATGVSAEEFTSALAKLEMDARNRLFLNASYAQLILAIRHLIVTGNVLIYRDSPAAKCTTYGMQNFSIRRDGKGQMLDCVLREFTYVEALDESVQAVLRASNKAAYSRPEQMVEVYTRIHKQTRNGTHGYAVSQEVDTIAVGEESWYPGHLCPWLAPTWSLITGEHLGRGMVEDYAGGFAKLSDLSEAHALYSIEMMKVIHLVGSASGADIDDFAGAETGEYIRGDSEAIKAHESGDAMKIEQVSREIERVFGRLAKAFMYTGSTRDAERVTAYELQRDALEAETTLGGTYSALSDSLQVPLAHLLSIEARPAIMAGILTDEVKLDVTAGIPALGRSSDVQNMIMASQEIAAVAPIAQLDPRINPQRVVDVILAGRSVDPASMFYSKEEQAQINASKQQVAQGQQAMLEASTVAAQAEQLGALSQ